MEILYGFIKWLVSFLPDNLKNELKEELEEVLETPKVVPKDAIDLALEATESKFFKERLPNPAILIKIRLGIDAMMGQLKNLPTKGDEFLYRLLASAYASKFTLLTPQREYQIFSQIAQYCEKISLRMFVMSLGVIHEVDPLKIDEEIKLVKLGKELLQLSGIKVDVTLIDARVLNPKELIISFATSEKFFKPGIGKTARARDLMKRAAELLVRIWVRGKDGTWSEHEVPPSTEGQRDDFIKPLFLKYGEDDVGAPYYLYGYTMKTEASLLTMKDYIR